MPGIFKATGQALHLPLCLTPHGVQGAQEILPPPWDGYGISLRQVSVPGIVTEPKDSSIIISNILPGTSTKCNGIKMKNCSIRMDVWCCNEATTWSVPTLYGKAWAQVLTLVPTPGSC